jgi:hypothetical protein
MPKHPAGALELVGGSTPVLERHYSVLELASAWNLSSDTIRRLFENEPGVLAIEGEARKFSRRRYVTLRIPESVALRVHRRRSKV